MPTLLLAPAASGKTRYAIEKIRDVLAGEPLAPVIAILPNQTRVAEFRRRLAAAGGALGVELFTFHTLYAEMLARAGQPKPRLLDPVRVRLLRAIIDRLCTQGQLRHYAALRAKPGFVASLRAIIELSLEQDIAIPEPYATRQFSGQLSLRLPPELQDPRHK